MLKQYADQMFQLNLSSGPFASGVLVRDPENGGARQSANETVPMESPRDRAVGSVGGLVSSNRYLCNSATNRHETPRIDQ